MWSIKRSNIQPIGLDIGHDSVKLMQLEVCAGSPNDKRGQSLSVVAAAMQATPDDARKDPARRVELTGSAVERLLAQHRFVGRKVVATLPRDMVHVRVLRLTLMPTSELEAAVIMESRGSFPFNLADAKLELLSAGEVRQGNEVRQEVIVLAAKKADVDNYAMQLDRCGLIVAGLETEPTALYRTFEKFIRRRDDEQDVQMVIDIGARRTQVVIGRGREICFCKPVEIGGLHLLDAIHRKLAITVDEARALRHRLLESEDTTNPASPANRGPVRQAVFDATRSVAEELGQELAMCLRYFAVTFRGHRSIRARLLGGEAGDPQLQAILQSSLNIPVETGRPLHSVDTSRMRPVDRHGSMSQWTLAMGLGLRFVGGYFAAKDGKPRAVVRTPAVENIG